MMNRRTFLEQTTGVLAGAALFQHHAFAADQSSRPAVLYKISLAQWSLHRTLRSGKLDALEFPTFTRKEFDIDAIEYVNQFFKDKARNAKYLGELKQRCTDANVKSLLIMIDGEGRLGEPDDAKRTEAIENHYRWVEAAHTLGCHSIRVNAASSGSPEKQRELVVDGLSRLTEFAGEHGLNVIVENHGGLSSNGAWLASVMEAVNNDRCGTLPDFGNFHTGGGTWYDRYKGVKELMPFAKAVSAKSHQFDADGNEKHTDYTRMMKIVLDAGYRGYVGIEWEGENPSEVEGIRATQSLLKRVRDELAADPAYATDR